MERVKINNRVFGYRLEFPEAGMVEFTIIEKINHCGWYSYTALLDDGTICPCFYENGVFIAEDLPF